MDLDALRTRWDGDLASAAPVPRRSAFDDVVARHGEGHRRYHTITHVVAVLDVLDELGVAAGTATRLAAWYHDAIYDPASPDNEARSASLAREALTGLGVDDATVIETARLIGLTRDHAVAPGDAAGAALVDADLSILGTNPATYDGYTRAVRIEYGHVPDDLWRAGRDAVLASLLDRPALFHTPLGQARWEAPARANLRRERAALASD